MKHLRNDLIARNSLPGHTVFRFSFGIFIVFTFLTISTAQQSLTGRQIMEKNDALPSAKTMQAYAYLFIFKGGCKSTKCAIRKEFTMQSKEYNTNNNRSLISFVRPTQLKFLTWSLQGGDNSQWIKPSRSKARKIASGDKGNSFVNSHFYYEDLGSRNINDFRYRLIGTKKVGNDNCYVVQSIKKKNSRVYSKLHVYVRQTDFVIVRIDFFEKGRHTKTLYNEKIQRIQGIYTPRKAVMVRTDGKGKSILYMTKIQYNVPVSDTKLKPNNL